MARPRSELGDIRTSARSVRLLRWLRRKPQPAKLQGTTDDGEEVNCVISGTGPATYTDAVSVVYHCSEILALDDKGNTLRRIELDPNDPELRAEAETEKALAAVTRSGGGSVPIISVDIPKLVDNIARNMREVAAESAKQQSAATKDGFTAMAGVVSLCMRMLVAMERRLADVQASAPEEESQPDMREQLAALALQKALGNGASNGSGGGGGFDLAKLAELGKMFQSMQQQQAPNGGGGDNES